MRNNTRVMWDDADEANALLARVASAVPARLSGMAVAGATHTVVEHAGGVRSLVTLVFYLNDGFEGGATEFPELGKKIEPRRGRALLFQHRVLHEATAVTRGEKLVLRTDVLYRDFA